MIRRLFLAFVGCLVAGNCWAAVSKDAASAVTNATASSAQHTEGSSSITVGASATLLIAILEADTSTPGTVSAVWDKAGANQTMTQIGSVVTESGGATPITLAVFGRVSPQSGAKLLSWTWSGQASAVNAYTALISFTGSDTTSVANATEAFASAHATTGANAAVSSAASIPSGDMAVAWYGNLPGFTNAFTPGGNPGDGGTAIGKNESLTTNAAAEYYSGAGAVINASAANASSAAWAALITGIKAAAAAATCPMTRAMMGVGC